MASTERGLCPRCGLRPRLTSFGYIATHVVVVCRGQIVGLYPCEIREPHETTFLRCSGGGRRPKKEAAR